MTWSVRKSRRSVDEVWTGMLSYACVERCMNLPGMLSAFVEAECTDFRKSAKRHNWRRDTYLWWTQHSSSRSDGTQLPV
jgi:hypothetical protein